MNEKFEIEYKTLIDNPIAFHLLSLDLFDYSGKQLNKYYDTTNNFFKNRRIFLRIREKAGKYLFTAKRETPEGLKETEFSMDSFNSKHEKIIAYMSQFDFSLELHEIGSTLTYRYTHQDQFGEWCLDFNVFSSSSDIELEYELKQNIFDKKDHFLEQLKKWGVPYHPCDSKFIRMKNES